MNRHFLVNCAIFFVILSLKLQVHVSPNPRLPLELAMQVYLPSHLNSALTIPSFSLPLPLGSTISSFRRLEIVRVCVRVVTHRVRDLSSGSY